MVEMEEKSSIQDLFLEAKRNKTYLKVCAPMVRYSKVQFRTLVRNYGVDLCFTPMILADSFCQNEKARANEFSTTNNDTPLIVQFASNNPDDFLDATKLIYPYVDGVDLNCGCPQKWAMKDGYGCAMLNDPELIHAMIRVIRNNMPDNFSVSVKIRILKELKHTVDLCKQLEMCGVTFLTVHGRTPTQKSGEKVDMNILREICQSLQVPIVANGGIKTLEDANIMFDSVYCRGVMAASGILTNPALFSGLNKTPLSCIKLWMDIRNKQKEKITFQCYHHHLVFMLEKVLSKQEKKVFNNLNSFESVDSFIKENIMKPCHSEIYNYAYEIQDFIDCEFSDEIILKHGSKCRGCGKSIGYCSCNKYTSDTSDGSFFSSYVKNNDTVDFMECNIFNESL